ncbi:hypothetical protein PO909_020605 [Leuciscus waleckii]
MSQKNQIWHIRAEIPKYFLPCRGDEEKHMKRALYSKCDLKHTSSSSEEILLERPNGADELLQAQCSPLNSIYQFSRAQKDKWCHLVVIRQRYSRFSWVAELIQIFITISVTVSFLVMGTAMKHTIDGLVGSHWAENAEWMARISARLLPHSSQRRTLAQSLQHCRRFFSSFMSFLTFGLIFVVSACDPKGFVVMLDKVVSFSLNTEVGLFIFLMLRSSRSERFKHLAVPLKASERLFRLHWLLPIYFLFAVAYDIFQTIIEITENVSLILHTNSSLG